MSYVLLMKPKQANKWSSDNRNTNRKREDIIAKWFSNAAYFLLSSRKPFINRNSGGALALNVWSTVGKT